MSLIFYIVKKLNIRLGTYFIIIVLAAMQTSCAGLDPKQVDVELEETLPYMTITSYTEALHNLGLMSEIYSTPTLRVQCNTVGDNTGASVSTGAEIPRDITEMMKSALNSMGGKIVYIPYDPAFIQNQMLTGYSNFAYKVIPDVVLTGGITEFDRGLVTRGSNTDLNASGEFKGLPKDMPSNYAELRYGGAEKSGLARITLDFNLLDFQTLTGIPKMNTTNSMEVRKALAERELGISLFGPSFGRRGSIKKVQGRHAAVRLLVEISMIQLVGKHLMLPYWRLLGPDAKPDRVVMNQIDQYYYSMTPTAVVACIQEWLYLYGFDTELTGQMDEATISALKTVYPEAKIQNGEVDLLTFRYVYLNIPISILAKKRREKWDVL